MNNYVSFLYMDEQEIQVRRYKDLVISPSKKITIVSDNTAVLCELCYSMQYRLNPIGWI